MRRDRSKNFSHMTRTNQDKANLSGLLSFSKVWSQKKHCILSREFPPLLSFNIISVCQNAILTGKNSERVS